MGKVSILHRMRGLFRKERPEDRAFELAQKELYAAFPKASVLEFTIPDLRKAGRGNFLALGTVQARTDGVIGRRCRYLFHFDPISDRGTLNLEPDFAEAHWGLFDRDYHDAERQMRCG